MAGTFSGAGDAVKAASESEVEKLHAKIGQLVMERNFRAKAFGRRAWSGGGRWSNLLTTAPRDTTCSPCLRRVLAIDAMEAISPDFHADNDVLRLIVTPAAVTSRCVSGALKFDAASAAWKSPSRFMGVRAVPLLRNSFGGLPQPIPGSNPPLRLANTISVEAISPTNACRFPRAKIVHISTFCLYMSEIRIIQLTPDLSPAFEQSAQEFGKCRFQR